jgi:hypothetical protein
VDERAPACCQALASRWRTARQQGKRAEADELLAPIYSWFTEGFDTADLQDARALLEALSGERRVEQTLPSRCQRHGDDLLAAPGRGGASADGMSYY